MIFEMKLTSLGKIKENKTPEIRNAMSYRKK